MKVEMKCKDCIYYKEWSKPLMKQSIGNNRSVEMETETLCKVHEKRYSYNCQWYPVNTQCFSLKK
jgi:hypothetical protein